MSYANYHSPTKLAEVGNWRVVRLRPMHFYGGDKIVLEHASIDAMGEKSWRYKMDIEEDSNFYQACEEIKRLKKKLSLRVEDISGLREKLAKLGLHEEVAPEPTV